MATQSQIEETCNYLAEVFRAAYGEQADCTGTELFNDSSWAGHERKPTNVIQAAAGDRARKKPSRSTS
jgi:hypothetical protein